MKIGLTNITGKMGEAMLSAISSSKDIEVSIGLSRKSDIALPHKVTDNISELLRESTVVIDFSSPLVSALLIEEALKTSTPLVIGTTNFTEKEKELLQQTAKKVPILYDSNMSVGINLINHILPHVVETLEAEYDIDIFEKHHKYKMDAPSGTALKLLETILQSKKIAKKYDVYNKNFSNKPRTSESVGVAYMRAGNVFGEHEVNFTSDSEVIKFTHIALNRELFAKGALKAAKWIVHQTAGLYSMQDLLNL